MEGDYLMGLAKYHEDNLEIMSERMYYRDNDLFSYDWTSLYSKKVKKNYKFFCPFCRKGYETNDLLVDHVISCHGGKQDIIYINGKRIGQSATVRVDSIQSFKLLSFRKNKHKVIIENNNGEIIDFWITPGVYFYDIRKEIKNEWMSEIEIKNIDFQIRVQRNQDINKASISKILSGRYYSSMFEERVIEETFSLEEYFIYLKMLINESENTDFFMDKISYIYYRSGQNLNDLFYYHLLSGGSAEYINSSFPYDVYKVFFKLINGDHSEAEVLLKEVKKQNDKTGCEIICGMLNHDRSIVDYQIEK